MNTRKTYIGIIAGLGLMAAGCTSMDITPKDQGNSASWYSTEVELQLAVNEFYILGYWNRPLESSEQWTDNTTYRQQNRAAGSGGSVLDGTMTGSMWEVYSLWQQDYKLISRANTLLENIHRAEENGVNPAAIKRFKAEAYFARACKYAELLFFFGDLPYMDKYMTISEAEAIGRKPKDEIIPLVYDDFDEAIDGLPVSWGAEHAHPTKGAAMAMKARFALYMGDWEIAAKAAKDCMDLNVYSLASDYGSVFLQSTGVIPEKVFAIPRSIENSVTLDEWFVKNGLPRNAGGYGSYNPSWDLLAAYLCTDGLPIDESPLFNPQKPFENRDPRCTATIVEFGTEHVGFIYDPSPAATKVLNTKTGAMQSNNDSRAVAQYASFNGLVWRKGIDQSWVDNFPKVAPDYIIMRYADVLLMYAEAKIELNEIDDTVLDAMNQVRARAYKAAVTATSDYPAITETAQDKLRTILRIERRMEFAFENLRLYDIWRWRIAEKVLNRPWIGLPKKDEKLQRAYIDNNMWFHGAVPEIDEDGCMDFMAPVAKGAADFFNSNAYAQVLAECKFVAPKSYLWPLPTTTMQVMRNIKENNPGY